MIFTNFLIASFILKMCRTFTFGMLHRAMPSAILTHAWRPCFKNRTMINRGIKIRKNKGGPKLMNCKVVVYIYTFKSYSQYLKLKIRC